MDRHVPFTLRGIEIDAAACVYELRNGICHLGFTASIRVVGIPGADPSKYGTGMVFVPLTPEEYDAITAAMDQAFAWGRYRARAEAAK